MQKKTILEDKFLFFKKELKAFESLLKEHPIYWESQHETNKNQLYPNEIATN